MPKVIHGAAPFSPAFPQRFHGHIEADLVPVLEAVGNGFGGIVNSYVHTLYEMLFNPIAKGISRKAHNVQREVISLGFSGFNVDGHPDFERGLSGKAMKAEGREETDDGVRDSLASLGDALVLTHLGIRQSVETSRHTLDQSPAAEPHQAFAGNAVGIQIPGPKEPSPFDKFNHLVRCCPRHIKSCNSTERRYLSLSADDM
jgi:hypothetical protein